MSGLETLQRQFLAHLRAPGEQVSGIAEAGIGAALGLRIYTHAYRARLVEALDSDHAMLGLYLGDDLWDALCDGYIQAHPSRVRSLRNFGASLPAWLAANAPFNGDPRIAELAAFERLLLDSFDAADAPCLAFNDLRARDAADWPALHLRLHPSVRVLVTTTNAVDAWIALRGGEAPPRALPSNMPAWASWRDADRVGRYRSVDALEWAALQGINGNGTIAHLCDRLAADTDAALVPSTLVRLLQRWFDEGWIAAID